MNSKQINTLACLAQIIAFVAVNALIVYLINRFAGEARSMVFILTYGLISIIGLLYGQKNK